MFWIALAVGFPISTETWWLSQKFTEKIRFEMAYPTSSTDTGLNENFDHVDLDVDLLILKRKVLSLSRHISNHKSFPFHYLDKM